MHSPIVHSVFKPRLSSHLGSCENEVKQSTLKLTTIYLHIVRIYCNVYMFLCLAIFCENFVTFHRWTIYYETYIKLLDLSISCLYSDREPDFFLPHIYEGRDTPVSFDEMVEGYPCLLTCVCSNSEFRGI